MRSPSGRAGSASTEQRLDEALRVSASGIRIPFRRIRKSKTKGPCCYGRPRTRKWHTAPADEKLETKAGELLSGETTAFREAEEKTARRNSGAGFRMTTRQAHWRTSVRRPPPTRILEALQVLQWNLISARPGGCTSAGTVVNTGEHPTPLCSWPWRSMALMDALVRGPLGGLRPGYRPMNGNFRRLGEREKAGARV